MSFSKKLYIIIGIFVSLFSLIVGYVIVVKWSGSLKDMTAARQSEDARQALDKIDRVLHERVVDVKNLALAPGVILLLKGARITGDTSAIVSEILPLANTSGPWEVLRYIKGDNVIVASDKREDIGKKLEDEHELSMMKKVMRGDTAYSDVHLHTNGTFHMLFASPIVDNTIQGKPVIGAVMGYFPFQVLQEILESIESSGANLLNNEGLEIGSNHEDVQNPNEFADYSKTQHFMLSQKQQGGVVVLPNLETDEPALVTFSHESGYLDYHGNNWSIFLQTPMSDINATIVKTIIPTVGLYTALVVVSMIVIVELLHFALLRPLSRLVIAVKSLSSGDLSSRVEINSSDEIGQLGKAFNDMGLALSGSYKDLEEKVKERTLELQVQSEESERKYKEYEEMNRLMVGREIKMTQLKKEIESLRAAMNKS